MSFIFSYYSAYFPRTDTLLISKDKITIRQYAEILKNHNHGLYKLKKKYRRYEIPLNHLARTLTEKLNVKVVVLRKYHRLTPYQFNNASKNGLYPNKAIALSYILEKAGINVKTLKTFTDYRYIDKRGKEKTITKADNAVIINSNIKIEFIDLPIGITFKINAPHQYIQRLYP